MTILPVIIREVREQARQNFTYSLRMLGVAAVLAACLWAAMRSGLLPGSGGRIFTWIHSTLLFAIWLLVPLSASDCLSRERRDGTLGLLFLTSLSASDIVFAKGAAHGLRALTLWLASLPVVAIPFLIGGLTWQVLALSCVINLSSIALALGASLLASSWCRQRHRALALAMMLALLLMTAHATALLISLFVGFGPFPTFTSMGQNLPPLEVVLTGAYYMISGADDVWAQVATKYPPSAQRAAIIALSVATALSLLFVFGLMLMAARNVRRRWQDQSRSARVEKLERVFCTPMMGQDLLQRWMRWKLDHNPIGWLEQRKWSGRLVMWSWVAVLVSFYSTVFSSRGFFVRGFGGLQSGFAWLLLISVAATAAGSFRRERETGVLELLLVSPLDAWKIINGRVRGIWGQFAPAVVLLVGVWVFASTFLSGVRSQEAIWFSIGFLTIPVIGLYYSLAKTHFLSSFLWTMVMGFAFPTLLVNGVAMRLRVLQIAGSATPGAASDPGAWHGPIWALTQLALAGGFVWLLHRNLEQRRFALERPAG